MSQNQIDIPFLHYLETTKRPWNREHCSRTSREVSEQNQIQRTLLPLLGKESCLKLPKKCHICKNKSKPLHTHTTLKSQRNRDTHYENALSTTTPAGSSKYGHRYELALRFNTQNLIQGRRMWCCLRLFQTRRQFIKRWCQLRLPWLRKGNHPLPAIEEQTHGREIQGWLISMGGEAESAVRIWQGDDRGEPFLPLMELAIYSRYRYWMRDQESFCCVFPTGNLINNYEVKSRKKFMEIRLSCRKLESNTTCQNWWKSFQGWFKML